MGKSRLDSEKPQISKLSGAFCYLYTMSKNLHKIVTWLVAFTLIGVCSYSLSLFYWSIGVIFALTCFLGILIKLPRDDK